MIAAHGRASLTTRGGRVAEARGAGVRRVVSAVPASTAPGPKDPRPPVRVEAARASRARGQGGRVPGSRVSVPNLAQAGGPPALGRTRHVAGEGGPEHHHRAADLEPMAGVPRDRRRLAHSARRLVAPARGTPGVRIRAPSGRRSAGGRRPALDLPGGATRRGLRRRTSAPACRSSGPRRPRIGRGRRPSGPPSVRSPPGPGSIGRCGRRGTDRRHGSGPRNPGRTGGHWGQPRPSRQRRSSAPTKS
jgi:hypothetical protein